MLNSIYFALVTNATMMSSDGNPLMALGISVLAGIIIAVSLLAQSRTKIKATKAEKYISSQLKLTGKSDVFSHTTTTRRKINN